MYYDRIKKKLQEIKESKHANEEQEGIGIFLLQFVYFHPQNNGIFSI